MIAPRETASIIIPTRAWFSILKLSRDALFGCSLIPWHCQVWARLTWSSLAVSTLILGFLWVRAAVKSSARSKSVRQYFWICIRLSVTAVEMLVLGSLYFSKMSGTKAFTAPCSRPTILYFQRNRRLKCPLQCRATFLQCEWHQEIHFLLHTRPIVSSMTVWQACSACWKLTLGGISALWTAILLHD